MLAGLQDITGRTPLHWRHSFDGITKSENSLGVDTYLGEEIGKTIFRGKRVSRERLKVHVA